MAEHVRE
jgi:hypothetical protein